MSYPTLEGLNQAHEFSISLRKALADSVPKIAELGRAPERMIALLQDLGLVHDASPLVQQDGSRTNLVYGYPDGVRKFTVAFNPAHAPYPYLILLNHDGKPYPISTMVVHTPFPGGVEGRLQAADEVLRWLGSGHLVECTSSRITASTQHPYPSAERVLDAVVSFVHEDQEYNLWY